MPHLTLLAFQNCAASAIYGCIDAFAISNRWYGQLNQGEDDGAPLFSWDIASIDGKPVEAEGRVTVTPHCSIHEVESTDFILIPGFLPPLDFIGDVPKELTAWIRRHHEKDVLVGTTCTGTFLLAETGLLDGKTATTNLKFSRYFQKLYPAVNLKPERILTEDSGFLCSGATTSVFDLCVYLIEKFGYEELAVLCSKALLMEPRYSQSPYTIFEFQKDHTDTAVKEAQCYMEERFTTHISVEALACDLGISPRHFVRRFKSATGDSPLLYLQRIRIEAAKQKLEKTVESIEEITQQVGYEDPNSFRKLFKKTTGLSPREYRNRFTRLLKPVPVSPKRRFVHPG
ncbi:MAG: helix-turn-helix domain-containing protein [Desulfatibacillum sp.]|nr:helix-turn-helix domain-containing protein [Desulfatibacillum sp.]